MFRALKEIAERLDGKVPQAIVGDEEHPPLVALQEFYAWMKQPAPPADTSTEPSSPVITPKPVIQ